MKVRKHLLYWGIAALLLAMSLAGLASMSPGNLSVKVSVTINQAAGQADPTNTSPIHFTVVFSTKVDDFKTGDVTITGTAPGTLVGTVTGSGKQYDVAVTGMTGSGTVIVNLAAGVAHDVVGNASRASTSSDNIVTYDVTPPNVTINQASGQADPTNSLPIHFTVVFSQAVSDFTAADVTISGTAPGVPFVTVTGSGTTYDVAVSALTGTGTVIATLAAGIAHDGSGNPSTGSTSTDNTVTYNVTPLTVTINQAIGQADPTNDLPIHFTVVFSKVVTDFAAADVTITGSAPFTAPTTPRVPGNNTRGTVTESRAVTIVVTGSGATYDVAVSGLTGSGTVIASLAAGVAHDSAANASTASTSIDHTVTYDVTSPTVTINQATSQSDPTDELPIYFTAVFSEVVTDFDDGDVTLTGTAPGILIGTVVGSGVTYTIAVTGLTGNGTVIADLAAGIAHDAAGNATLASTSVDKTVTYVKSDPLGLASDFGAFGGGAGITNQGIFTVINGDIGTTGVSTIVTGFHDSTGDRYTETPLNIGNVVGRIYTAPPPPVIYLPGGPFGGTAETKAIADQCALDALTEYNYLAGLPTTGPDPSAAGELSGLTVAPGVYKAAGDTFNLLPGGTLTLDALGDANAVWVFQMGASLNVGAIGAGLTPARVVFKDGVGQASNVFWQVGSSATINTGAEMIGTIIASAGISFSTAGEVILTTLEGRALALNASVTMVNTIINVP